MFVRRSQRHRPKMLPKASSCYDSEYSKYPDHIRVLFDDGKTVIYDARVRQPGPIVLETIELIRKMKNQSGYVYEEARYENRET